MKNKLTLGAVLSVAAAATVLMNTAVAADTPNGEVRIYNWSDYIEESILSDFEKDTGIKIVYDVFDSDELLEAKLLAGKSGYDVVFPSSSFMGRQIQAKLFQPLQKEKLPNSKHIWDFVAKKLKTYDPDNTYSVNYMWGTTGLGLNIDKIKEVAPDAPLDSWSLLFNPQYAEKIAKCGIYVLDVPDEIVPAALAYEGKDPSTHDKKTLLSTQTTLNAIRPFIKQFSNSNYVDALANGDICLAVGYSGDIIQAADRAIEAKNGVEVNYVIPKEGAQLWFDQMVIPTDAPNSDNAHIFINYLMQPKVIARASDYAFYANGIKDSIPFINKEITEDKTIYPDEATMNKLFTKILYKPRLQKAINRMWTNFKANR
ncbi:MAG: polyamine ABC transporter substrate-binding protein [Gammaproteobacteria bacterium]|nr:polyamine ABC transporter substrate-binding protein [Gammaproteobacteria bacterium]